MHWQYSLAFSLPISETAPPFIQPEINSVLSFSVHFLLHEKTVTMQRIKINFPICAILQQFTVAENLQSLFNELDTNHWIDCWRLHCNFFSAAGCKNHQGKRSGRCFVINAFGPGRRPCFVDSLWNQKKRSSHHSYKLLFPAGEYHNGNFEDQIQKIKPH